MRLQSLQSVMIKVAVTDGCEQNLFTIPDADVCI